MTESADDLLLLHEIIRAARERLDDGPWEYLVGGAETETTLKRNRQALDSVAFRPRVMRDVLDVDCGGELLGHRLRLPVVLAPIGSLQDLHPSGGLGPARAAASFGVVNTLSSVCKPGLEAVAAAADGPRIFQLYVRGDPDWVDEHVRRAIDAGFHAVCFTVDLDYYARRERDIAKRFKPTARANKPPDVDAHQQRFDWSDVDRVKARFDVPVAIKGIATAEDATVACEHGVDVVWVSNHGGRQLDHGRGSLDVLPEVVAAVAKRAEIVIDGGFLRGSDVAKAMALGADAVAVGRLTGFAMGAAGEAGVVRALEILEGEYRSALGMLGVTHARDLDATYLHPATPVSLPSLRSAVPLLDVDAW